MAAPTSLTCTCTFHVSWTSPVPAPTTTSESPRPPRTSLSRSTAGVVRVEQVLHLISVRGRAGLSRDGEQAGVAGDPDAGCASGATPVTTSARASRRTTRPRPPASTTPGPGEDGKLLGRTGERRRRALGGGADHRGEVVGVGRHGRDRRRGGDGEHGALHRLGDRRVPGLRCLGQGPGEITTARHWHRAERVGSAPQQLRHDHAGVASGTQQRSARHAPQHTGERAGRRRWRSRPMWHRRRRWRSRPIEASRRPAPPRRR